MKSILYLTLNYFISINSDIVIIHVYLENNNILEYIQIGIWAKSLFTCLQIVSTFTGFIYSGKEWRKIGKKVNKIITDCEKFYKMSYMADGKKYNQSSLWGDKKKFSLQILEEPGNK